MHNPERGEVTVRLGGEDHVLRPTFQALCEIEAATGEKLVPLVQAFAAGRYGARDLAIVVTAGLRGAGERDAKVETVGAMLAGQGFADQGTLQAVVTFLSNALSGGTKPGEATAAAR